MIGKILCTLLLMLMAVILVIALRFSVHAQTPSCSIRWDPPTDIRATHIAFFVDATAAGVLDEYNTSTPEADRADLMQELDEYNTSTPEVDRADLMQESVLSSVNCVDATLSVEKPFIAAAYRELDSDGVMVDQSALTDVLEVPFPKPDPLPLPLPIDPPVIRIIFDSVPPVVIELSR